MSYVPVVYTDSNYVQIKTDYINFNPLDDPSAASNLTNFPFVQNYNSNYLQLPIASTLEGIDPSAPQYNTNLIVQSYPIGYDQFGVSDDLTDYRGFINGQPGFVPDTIFRVDPTNDFTFQAITPFDSNVDSYFGPGSENSILLPVTNEVYTFQGTSSSQIKIVHWYDDYYIPKQIEDNITTTSTIGISPYVRSIQEVPNLGYPIGANGVIQFGRGINAIGFLPTDGIYTVSSFTFKSAIYPLEAISTTTEDPNTAIKYIGVFSGLYLASRFIDINSALTVLKFAQSQVYSPNTLCNSPGFGVEYGTYYEYWYDSNFVAASNVKINGYTQGSNELVSYDSMYYMVPFNASFSNITFTNLTGSLIPYPLTQVVSTGSTYFGQTVKSLVGTRPQSRYIMPSTIEDPFAPYGPQGLVPYTQSQYELSQAIMTNSIGFREIQSIVTNQYALFPFRTTFSNLTGPITSNYVGLTTSMSEYNDTMYLVNSLSNGTNISNHANYQGSVYASSMSTTIGLHGGTLESMHYLLNAPSTLNNYPYSGLSNLYSTILFENMDLQGTNSNITMRKLDLDLNTATPFITTWLWGGGGGTWTGGVTATGDQMGGAGAYAKVQINIQSLASQFGVSTLYFVIGKGGNRDNVTFSSNGAIQGYEQPRYGGGGTSLIELSPDSPATDNIHIQGGGFTGIFLDSNLATATPLIIVGGGGAGGAYTMGGPGGFGTTPIPLPIEILPFNNVDLTTLLYPRIGVIGSFDWSSLYPVTSYLQGNIGDDYSYLPPPEEPYPVATTDPVVAASYLTDGNNQTIYQPKFWPYQGNQVYVLLNGPTSISTYDPVLPYTKNVWQFNVNLASNVSSISKLRVISQSPVRFTVPTGFVVYNDKNKSQMLYSNSLWDSNGSIGTVLLSNGWYLPDPSVPQVAYDLPITQVISNQPNVTSGWVTCGTNLNEYDTIQYSLDGSNWANIRSQTGPSGFVSLTQTNSVVYAGIPSGNGGGYWYACGSNTIIRSSNGLDWSATGITNPYTGGSLNTLAVGSNYILAAGTPAAATSNSILRTTNGTTWSYTTNAFTSNVTMIRYTGPMVWAISPTATPSLKYSLTGTAWTNIGAGVGILSGAKDIAYDGLSVYVVAMGDGIAPLRSPLVYGTALSSNVPPTSWSAATPANLANFTCLTVCYGNGVFVAGGSTSDGSSPAKWSGDGINWYNTDIIPVTPTLNYAAAANGKTVAQSHTAGTTIYTLYGTTPTIYDMIINKITFNPSINKFTSSGRGTSIYFSQAGNNQLSVLTSENGVNWSLSYDGGFNNNWDGNGTYAAASDGDYGPLRIIPNLSSIYVEVEKVFTYDNWPVRLAEIQVYGKGATLSPQNPSNAVSTIYDSNLATYWWPNETEVSDFEIKDYSLTFIYSTPQTLLSKLTFYCPTDETRFFTGLTAALTQGTNPVYNSPQIAPLQFIYDPVSELSYFDAVFIPALSNVSTLYIDVLKTTPTSVQINEVRAQNDPNKPVVTYKPDTVVFAAATTNGTPDNTSTAPGYPLTNMYDDNLETYWQAANRRSGGTVTAQYEFNFTFNDAIPRINFIQFYTGNYTLQNNRNGISGVVVYTDSSKSSILYSNTLTFGNTLGVNQYGYQYIGFNIIPYANVSNIYITMSNLAVNDGVPLQINEITFVNFGLIQDTPAGYTGGTIADMQRQTIPTYAYDGGGGSNLVGGLGGEDFATPGVGPTIVARTGLNGSYLKGGSPASAGEYTTGDYTTIVFGAGGGGGGYYGGGGGGIVSYNASGLSVYEGGAGGGGAGYFNTAVDLITLLDYGVASPGDIPTQTPFNYYAPGIDVQNDLITSNVLIPFSNELGYGAGATQTTDDALGQGAHGVILLNFDAAILVEPIGDAMQVPSFVEGSRLSLFEAPISYTSDTRVLPFTAYTDPIQYSPYSNYNWVWYQAYLSLTGFSLNPQDMTRIPSVSPYTLPTIVYSGVQRQFSNVSSFFDGGSLSEAPIDIIEGLQTSFELFNQYFVNTPYTDEKYVKYTEVYCLLDYLRQTSNLLNPHVDSITSPINRVFGGLPNFGYWANPFFTNVSYVGFDTGPSLAVSEALSTITLSSDRVTAFYGLALEQDLVTGVYSMTNVMAYKPTFADAYYHGSNWLKATQFNESYIVNRIVNSYLTSNIIVQPYTMKSAIGGNLPLFNYKVYTSQYPLDEGSVAAPIQMINDFQGQYAYLYTFQNSNVADLSSIHLTTIPLTSSIIQVNQVNITNLSNAASNIIGTVVSEYDSTVTQAVTQFGFDLGSDNPLNPIISFNTGSNNYYNTYSVNSPIQPSSIGKAVTDYIGNLFVADRHGQSNLYENVCTIQIFQQPFSNQNMQIASPSYILNEYNQGVINPHYDFLQSKSQNIWQLQGTQNLSTIYGARLASPYDFTVATNFANQIFYPTMKIVLTQTGTEANPIQDTTDLTNYPSFPKTQSFFYRNHTSMVRDISGQFALEKTSNFAYADTKFSGYFFNSFIQNINMAESTDFNNTNKDSFNYLAIRAYSPSESFKTLVRFYLPGRYDFGYISLTDLSNEVITLQTNSNVNPDYLRVLGIFTSSFSLSRVFGGTGLPGYSGSNITSVTFGDFLNKYSTVQTIIASNSGIIDAVNKSVLEGQQALITGDLKFIIPAYVATRERVYDPLEFSLPFSTIAQSSNRTIEEYGIGYNLGFNQSDTAFNTRQGAGSFFKILDDYIYLKMNPEYNMNRLDVSRQENLAATQDPQAESHLYNCKLILNNFGTYATTFVQNPVLFNPPIGKLDKLTFSWYDTTGALINNDECEWSGAIQIVETQEIVKQTSMLPSKK
jgi:hypothetical protein